MSNDQKQMWNDKHAANELAFGQQPSDFALGLAGLLKASDAVLEIGCGEGGDAELFADSGAAVIATDFSDVVIAKNRQRQQPNLTFRAMDASAPFPFADESFSIIYSHLALHYWDEVTTGAIFKEIARVLRPGGTLIFRCKSTDDPDFGQGEEIATGLFVKEGHLRHFFSPDYTRHLLAEDFEITDLQETTAEYAGKQSAFIDCKAVKKVRSVN